MKKAVLLIFLITLTANASSALTQIPNANTTETFHYRNNTDIDTVYQLYSNDSLSKLNVVFDGYGYPFTNTYILKDNSNNSLAIIFTYYKVNNFFFVNEVRRNVTVFYNNQPLLLNQKGFFSGDVTAFEVQDKGTTTNIFNNKDNLINIIKFEPSQISIDSNIFNQIIIITNVKNTYGYLENPFFATRIELPSNDLNKFELQEINIDYNDIGISRLQYEVNKDLNGLSAPFMFIFLFLKLILTVLNFTTIISDIDFYLYQIWFITPLKYIDFLIGIFFNVLRFISIMGFVWTFAILECIIIIINWIKTGDIINTIIYSIRDSYNFWNAILLKPLNWIFTKLLLFWTGK